MSIKKMKLIVELLVLLALSIVFILIRLGHLKTVTPTPNDHVRIDSLRFCGLSHVSMSSNLKISICGLLVADYSSTPLRMYLYELPDKTLAAENPVTDRFATGEFVKEFEVQKENGNGSYLITIYFYKTVVGKLEFNTQKP